MSDEHVCDSRGDVTLGMDSEGFMVERIRCSVCSGVQVEKRTNPHA